MSLLVAKCPRCGAAKMTFQLLADTFVGTKLDYARGTAYTKQLVEAFALCPHCKKSTVFLLGTVHGTGVKPMQGQSVAQLPGAVNEHFNIEGYISLKDMFGTSPPDHLPEGIDAAFREGATCVAVGCPNAAGTMFRLCIDLATSPMLPPPEAHGGPTSKQRRDLGLRLPWLFENKLLPEDLHGLASCIKEDGNDGAHRGTLSTEDVEDLKDFTVELLERLYTQPERLKIAAKRRDERRSGGDGAPSASEVKSE